MNPRSYPEMNVFHDHLDVCAQCREDPFNLCVEGQRRLKEAVVGIPAYCGVPLVGGWCKKAVGHEGDHACA